MELNRERTEFIFVFHETNLILARKGYVHQKMKRSAEKREKSFKKCIALPAQHLMQPYQPCYAAVEWRQPGTPELQWGSLLPSPPVHGVISWLRTCLQPLPPVGSTTQAQLMAEPCFLWCPGLTKPGKLRASSGHFAVSCFASCGCAVGQKGKKSFAFLSEEMPVHCILLGNSFRIKSLLDALKKFY